MVTVETLPKDLRTIVIGNNREYFAPLDSHIASREQQEWVQADIDEADMDLMWLGDNKVVVLPSVVDPAFIGDIKKLMGFKKVQVLVPQPSTTHVSADLLNNPGDYNTLSEAIRNSARPNVVAWGHTPQFERLVGRLKGDGLSFGTPETPLERATWTPDYFDSKIGSRELLLAVQRKVDSFKVPEGFVCDTVGDAIRIARYFIESKRGVAFKANTGGAGAGIALLPPSEFTGDFAVNYKKIEDKLEENPLFQAGALIIEEYVPPDFRRFATFPSVDTLVRPDGTVEVQSVDAMVIKHGEDGHVGFYGCLLGKGLYSNEEQRRLTRISERIGEQLYSYGYHGWFDTDYIFSTDGRLFANECNVRRTSICYMLDIGEVLFGEGFQDRLAMRSNDKYIGKNLSNLTYGQLKEILGSLMFPMAEQPKGVVITQSFRSMFGRGKFGYVVVGKDQEEAAKIERGLEKRLKRI